VLTSLIPLFVGPAVLLPIAAYAVMHRRVRAAGWYALLLAAIAHWSITYAWELTAGALEFKVLVLKIKYLGVLAIPAIWIGFVLDFVGAEPARIRRTVRVVAAFSAAMLALAWTDGWHHAFWGPITVDTSGPFDLLIGRGPGFYINIFFTYAALWAGIGVLATWAFLSPYLYAKRCGILIAATILPWLGNLAFLMEADTVANIDPTPFLFACTGVGAVVAVFHYRMLDPIPALSDARVENLGDGVLVVDPVGRLADMNGAAQAILGRRTSEVAGTPLDHVLPGWTLSRLTTGSEDLTLTTPGGAVRTFETQAVAIHGGSDGPTGYMVLLHDVTERRVAAATIRESEQRYRQLVENAHDLIFTINRAGLVATGYGREEIVGRTLADLVTAETRPRLLDLLQAARDGAPLVPVEIALTAKNGRRVPLEVASWLQGTDGPNRTIQAIGRDQTTRERYEDQLRQSQKMEAVGKLAAGIAHDFNNLLTAILGFTDIAERPLPPESPSRPPLAQIRRSGQQAAALTRQLLAFARRQILQPVVLDLNSAISDLGTMLSRLLGEDVTIGYSLAHDVRRVRVDLAQIQQVIVNLAVNARDAMPRGGELRIETSNVAIGATPQPATSLPAGTYVSLSVSDTGEGIPDDVLGHIFEPFFTTKAMGQGTGLGLATVHGIIKQSGGDILVRTAPGRGTTFTIYLPATDAPLPLDDRVVLADARMAVPGTVLLIEDDDAVREFAREVLRSRGWRVIEAAGPVEALSIATEGEETFDVVVTDVVMPGLSGGELADRLEQLHPGVPVLFVSGYADVDVIGRGQLRAGRQLLSKPFTGAELAYRVQELFAATRPSPYRRRH
jgi:two-component system cell cycle sensor histidine kinase/response regulator CckA